jgi:excisionase family DNA binding protein
MTHFPEPPPALVEALGPSVLEGLREWLVAATQPGEPARPLSPYANAKEAADLLRCRVRRIYELIAEGRLTKRGEGRRVLLLREEVIALAEGQTVGRALTPSPTTRMRRAK